MENYINTMVKWYEERVCSQNFQKFKCYFDNIFYLPVLIILLGPYGNHITIDCC